VSIIYHCPIFCYITFLSLQKKRYKSQRVKKNDIRTKDEDADFIELKNLQSQKKMFKTKLSVFEPSNIFEK